MLGRRQRLVLILSFLLGGSLPLILQRLDLVLPAAGLVSETEAVPAAPVEIGELRDTGPLVRRVLAVSSRYGVDPALVLAVIEVESGRDIAAVSDKGAVGLMQVMPETAAAFGIDEPADPAANVEAGTRYLARLLDSFGGDVELALAAYNAGPGAVRRWGTIPPYRETRAFVARVAEAYQGLTGADLLTSSRGIETGGEPRN